jgi:hypothetical protein
MQAEGENSSSSRVSKATKLFAVALVGSALLVASVLQLEENQHAAETRQLRQKPKSGFRVGGLKGVKNSRSLQTNTGTIDLDAGGSGTGEVGINAQAPVGGNGGAKGTSKSGGTLVANGSAAAIDGRAKGMFAGGADLLAETENTGTVEGSTKGYGSGVGEFAGQFGDSTPAPNAATAVPEPYASIEGGGNVKTNIAGVGAGSPDSTGNSTIQGNGSGSGFAAGVGTINNGTEPTGTVLAYGYMTSAGSMGGEATVYGPDANGTSFNTTFAGATDNEFSGGAGNGYVPEAEEAAP